MARERELERERARIAQDIHDDLGASLTRIGMLSESAVGESNNSPQADANLSQIHATTGELTRAMDEIVWAVNPRHDTLGVADELYLAFRPGLSRHGADPLPPGAARSKCRNYPCVRKSGTTYSLRSRKR